MKLERIGKGAQLAALLTVSALACSRGEPETAYASAIARRSGAAQPALQETAKAPALRLVLAPTGNAVRYRVRERLVGHDLPTVVMWDTTPDLRPKAAGRLSRPTIWSSQIASPSLYPTSTFSGVTILSSLVWLSRILC